MMLQLALRCKLNVSPAALKNRSALFSKPGFQQAKFSASQVFSNEAIPLRPAVRGEAVIIPGNRARQPRAPVIAPPLMHWPLTGCMGSFACADGARLCGAVVSGRRCRNYKLSLFNG